jgi:hypothetical protein
MGIRESLGDSDTSTLTAENQGTHEYRNIVWRGLGARLQIAKQGRESSVDVFVLKRVDTPIGREDPKKPVVVRAIVKDAPHQANDYVFYPDAPDDGRRVAEYCLPKDIVDISGYVQAEYLRERPIPTHFLDINGIAIINAMAATALAKPNTVIDVNIDGVPIQFRHLESLSLTEAGTPPVYPMYSLIDVFFEV